MEQVEILNQDKKFVQLYTSLQFTSVSGISYAIRISLVYNYNWKSVAFSQVFWWQSKLHEEFSLFIPLTYLGVFEQTC